MIRPEAQTHRGGGGFGMPDYVVQSFLQNSIDMNRFLARHRGTATLFLISYNDPGLLSELRYVRFDRFLQAVIVQNGRMQRLRQASQALECGLGDLPHLRQLDPESRVG